MNPPQSLREAVVPRSLDEKRTRCRHGQICHRPTAFSSSAFDIDDRPLMFFFRASS
jgi:hypothetical protein